MALIIPSNKNDTPDEVKTKKIAKNILYLSKLLAETKNLSNEQWKYISNATTCSRWDKITEYINSSIKTYNNWKNTKNHPWEDHDAEQQLIGLRKIFEHQNVQIENLQPTENNL